MKSSILNLTLLLVTVAVPEFTSTAGPLRRGDVAAEPSWLVHVDCDVLRSTSLGRFLEAQMDKPEAQAKLAVFQALVNFDLRTQLHGLTLYSTGAAPEDGVLIVYADFDAERLVTLARAAKDSQSTPYRENVIYNWIDDKKHSKNGVTPRTYAAIQGKAVVFGQREQPVAQALDVMTGAAANLSRGNLFPTLGSIGNTSFIQAAARKMDFAQNDPNAQVLRLSKCVMLEINEAQQQLSVALTLEAKDEEVANNITSILNGLVSLMKLQTDKPQSVKLGEAIALRQDGPTVHANLALPAEDVIQLMKADAARKAEKKAAKSESE
jgi:hypothetical protein